MLLSKVLYDITSAYKFSASGPLGVKPLQYLTGLHSILCLEVFLMYLFYLLFIIIDIFYLLLLFLNLL